MLILLYHRIDVSLSDRWGLCVSPRNFESHMQELARGFSPQPLSEISRLLRLGRAPRRVVAVTFDDGYQDNLTTALPILRRWGIPATFFLCGEASAFEGAFWWE